MVYQSINQQNLHNLEYRSLVEWLELLSKILKWSSININIRPRYKDITDVHTWAIKRWKLNVYSKESNIMKNLKQVKREEWQLLNSDSVEI